MGNIDAMVKLVYYHGTAWTSGLKEEAAGAGEESSLQNGSNHGAT
jgi:endoglucanase Acf2